jgi:hypothetical protein
MRQFGDLGMPKGRDAASIHSSLFDLSCMLICQLGMFKSLSGALLSRLVISFFMGFRSATMHVGGAVVQLGGSLMILVMRSVVMTSRHFYRLPIFAGTWELPAGRTRHTAVF